MNKRNKLIIFVAVLMLTIVSVPSISAYFSTYTMTKGSKKIVIQGSDHMNERVESSTKKVAIEATDNSEAIFVRVQAFAPDYIQSILEYNGNDWSKNGDYFYYAKPIDGKEDTDLSAVTADLNIVIPADKLPKDSKEGDQFHIVVVYEATPYTNGAVNNPAYWENAPITDGGNS